MGKNSPDLTSTNAEVEAMEAADNRKQEENKVRTQQKYLTERLI
jgi:hypothetical protein